MSGLAALLMLGTLAGCIGNGSFSEADTQGPTVDLRGLWINEYAVGYAITQDGQSVTLEQTVTHHKTHGTVKGRVFVSDDQQTAITVAPDGAQASENWGGRYFWTLRKRILGFAADDPVASRNPIFEGGLVCQLPFNGDGTLAVTLQGTFRRCVVQLVHFWHEKLSTEGIPGCKPFMSVTPIEEPRPTTVWDLVGKNGEPLTHFQAITIDALRQARARSSLCAKRTGEVGGKPCWWILAPFNNRGRGWWTSDDVLIAELYLKDPDSGALPLDVAGVARHDSKSGWQPLEHVLVSESEWTNVRANLEGGRVVGVQPVLYAEPQVEWTLFGAERNRDGALPWILFRNRMAIILKNRTLPKLLREAKTSDLSNLVLRIEQVFLEVTREAESCKDAAQRMIETNSGDPTRLTNLAHAYQEEVVVWKPILAAIKDELANRGK